MDPIGFIIWIIVGGIIGWLASLVMKRDAQQGILLNIIVGIVGAFLGGIIANALNLGGGTFMGYVMAFIGAVILLAIVNLFTRGRAR